MTRSDPVTLPLPPPTQGSEARSPSRIGPRVLCMASPDCSLSSSLGQQPRPHLAQWPRGALGAVAAEAVRQVLAEATMAGVAGTRVQLQLTVPATKAPRAHTLVAGRQVLAQGEETQGGVSPQRPPPPGAAPAPTALPRVLCTGAGRLRLTLQVPPC